jgi:hypothetical protein
MKFREYDPVRTRRDFLEQGITKGEVIIAFTKPNEAYEVEFDDGNGRTKATFPILPDDLEKVLVS